MHSLLTESLPEVFLLDCLGIKESNILWRVDKFEFSERKKEQSRMSTNLQEELG